MRLRAMRLANFSCGAVVISTVHTAMLRLHMPRPSTSSLTRLRNNARQISQHANANQDCDCISFRQSYAATALGRVGRDSLASQNSTFKPYEEPHMLIDPHGPGFIPPQLGDQLDDGR
ncbi:hypothetical protein OH76DRAFT_1409439 [Lentinus brumalis]|uniref:Uncharacterized protein n=1 Tax=Lentinus brumalis TaxID=2498619 RepID=A0A371CUY3_9APHY|nr:hypothetical protein OH76DRAFT_1409439 [Polyporus brumalis]